jgi:hypothetical protein
MLAAEVIGCLRMGNALSVHDVGIGRLGLLARLALVFWSLRVDGIKRLKGIWWMPWHREAKKDVTGCEKSWGAASKL